MVLYSWGNNSSRPIVARVISGEASETTVTNETSPGYADLLPIAQCRSSGVGHRGPGKVHERSQRRDAKLGRPTQGDRSFADSSRAMITAHASAPIRITTAKDCSGALARLSDVRLIPNLVIADMGVLEFGGVELLKRCNPREIPVVVFSGSTNPADQERAMRLGAKEFINKPIELDDYVAAVWGMIGKWAEPQA
jgi:CheY-like chemotaxis protein